MKFILILCAACCVVCPPIKQHKLPNEELKKELGDAYPKYLEHKSEFALKFMKEWIAAKPEDRPLVFERWNRTLEKNSAHEPIHAPGSQELFKETWQDDDDMDEDNYDVKSFFKMHDFDNDGYLTGAEIRALYYSQLRRSYATGVDDASLRDLDDTRMNTSILELMDKNKDGKISYEEFITYEPVQDWEEDWVSLQDMEELPDVDHLENNNFLLDAARKDLEKNPDDPTLEELMHKLSGIPALPDAQPQDVFRQPPTPHKEHDTLHQPVQPLAASSLPSPSAASAA